MPRRLGPLVIPTTLTMVVLGGSATVCTPSSVRAPTDAALDAFMQSDAGPVIDHPQPVDTGVDVLTPTDLAADLGFNVAPDGSGLDATQPPTADVYLLEGGVVCVPPPVIPDAQLGCGTCTDPDGGPSDCELCPFGPDGGLEPVCGVV